MPVDTIGISIQPETKKALDKLAKQFGLSRSATVAKLVELQQHKNGQPDVTVDGVRYVPLKA